MKQWMWVSLVLSLWGFSIQAEPLDDLVHFLPADADQVYWVFTGVVSNEAGEQYGYVFQMKREGALFRSTAALVDAQTKAVVFEEENQAELANSSTLSWQVGSSFLRFNPITDSWVFGVKTADKRGFNFKTDVLKQDNHAVEEGLRPGVSIFVNQTHALNGHITLIKGQADQFVTAKHTWFRQMWTTANQIQSHAVNGVLCQFDDGSGLYSVKLPEVDAMSGAMAGFFDSAGVLGVTSQFIRVSQRADGPWDIHLLAPKLNMVLTPYLQKQSVVAGFVTGSKSSGFCLLSDDAVGHA